jgi:hypothetical protein
MKERPILFSGPMVRAILEGRKTQTRRVVKPGKDKGWGIDLAPCEIAGEVNCGDYQNCPYGVPGDRLWVRETWGYLCSDITRNDRGIKKHTVEYRADAGKVTHEVFNDKGLPRPRKRCADENYEDYINYLERWWKRWRPSIHMPRWASRITLEIKSIRVERLQDISRDDALAEGIERWDDTASITPYRNYRKGEPGEMNLHCSTPERSFMTLWESINGPGSWDANPWVWVVHFERTQDTGGSE